MMRGEPCYGSNIRLDYGGIKIIILEINQEADGRVRIPEVLRGYLGGKTHIGR